MFNSSAARSWRAVLGALLVASAVPAQALIVSSNSDGVEGRPLSLRMCTPEYFTGPVESQCTTGFFQRDASPRNQAVATLGNGLWRGRDANGTVTDVPAPATPDEASGFQELADATALLDAEFAANGRDFTLTLRSAFRGTLLMQVKSVSSNDRSLLEHYLFEDIDASAGARFVFSGLAFDAPVAWINVLTPQGVPAPATLALALAGLAGAAAARRRAVRRA